MTTKIWSDDDQFRYFLFVVYPESAPKDWVDRLRETRLEFAVSPLHTKPEKEDEQVKPHHHVIFHTPGNKPWRFKRAKKLLDATEVPANGYIEPAMNARSSQRYLIHLDDKEKEQWEEGLRAITLINDFPLDLTRDLTAAEKREVRRKVFEFIDKYQIDEYWGLIKSLLDGYGDMDMLDYACNHTIMFNAYLTSFRHSHEQKEEKDENNG